MRRRNLIREVLSSAAGKVGVALAVVLVVAAVFVVAVYPWDFGPSRWSNPTVWADYPQAVPPAWTAAVSAETPVEHRIIETAEPSSSTERGDARVDSYDLVYEHTADEAPSFLSFSLADVSYQERPPSLSVTLLRPFCSA